MESDAVRRTRSPIAGVLEEMRAQSDRLPARLRHHGAFLGTYLRTTEAVGAAVSNGLFEDAGWVERWDAEFAELYFSALTAEVTGDGRVPRPWQLAFGAEAHLPPLLHVLLGINAHVNYDLPQALLAVISTTDMADARLLDRRRRDHERIDQVLAARVAVEDYELGGQRRLIDHALTPLNRAASKRFLREARRKVWQNTLALHAARTAGPAAYRRRIAELEALSAARIADLLRPGQVLLRLAVAGFGVRLPPVDGDQ